MQPLAFPPYEFRFKNTKNKPGVFDVIRKKFVVLTPEEWVRQHCVHYLHQDKGYPLSLINVEKQLEVSGLKKRYDVVVFHPDGKIRVLVECKAPSVAITQDTFDQIARYNLALNADLLMVTNGLAHYYCQLDYTAGRYNFLPELPVYN
ncbi:type I restriction enzyme HsdR N-terminal domain-containing protein [Gilvibacter sediminis]|uniref:type I restriction enzyme HsdR N-terminal domain-containing protein n=1 Tax=Gilvibacter sediminis TaxID=379071 RepID=UPI0023500053|nr:type I restriction enzyme HsdR N-terminal domain-containing protein [Gilvibacter sediminis]MDC7997940.1 type I restriction enzyme HsdR N-terminal domain-containing protein [Gilvibacter sediminis]